MVFQSAKIRGYRPLVMYLSVDRPDGWHTVRPRRLECTKIGCLTEVRGFGLIFGVPFRGFCFWINRNAHKRLRPLPIMNKSSIRTRTTADGELNSSLQAVAKYFLDSGYSNSNAEVLRLDNRTTIHWRKRSGIGLCAVAYVISPGPGRGETIYLSTFNRIASGKGNSKFREKLVEALEVSHRFETGAMKVSIEVVEKITVTVGRLMQSEKFQLFLKAGQKKADHHAAIDYLRRHSSS